MKGCAIAMDTIDQHILDVLQIDGRITNSALADAVGLSPSACLRRVKALEKAEIIGGYRAILNWTALGMAASVFVEVSVDSQEGTALDKFEAAVIDHPAVVSCHLMTGNFDYLVHVVCEDAIDYETLHRTHLSKLPGVSRIQSSFALREVTKPNPPTR